MGTTPTWQLPYPNPSDPADVPTDMAELCNRLEAVLTSLKSGGAIPGEVRMWSGAVVPPQATFGHWVWADGGSYDSATYPIAAGNIAPAWNTHGGLPDPGAGKFRVPDLRGQTPVALDAMPGGARANRITRAAAATLGALSGEEWHTLGSGEMPSHGHGVSDPTHAHGVSDPSHAHGTVNQSLVVGVSPSFSGGGGGGQGNINSSAELYNYSTRAAGTGIGIYGAGTGISIAAAGGGGAHENLPPSTFVPYIVKLDD